MDDPYERISLVQRSDDIIGLPSGIKLCTN